MSKDKSKNLYGAAQKQRIVERLIVERAKSKGWSPLKTYNALKNGTLLVKPVLGEWDDENPVYNYSIADESLIQLPRKWWKFSNCKSCQRGSYKKC